MNPWKAKMEAEKNELEEKTTLNYYFRFLRFIFLFIH